MTDTEIKRRKAICEAAGVKEIDDVSDGFHTFRQLYFQRMMLFATIVKQNKDRAWKSLRHEDGELCFGGEWFIVGIDTPEGSYTYHYETVYWFLFDCQELERSKHWDGHTEKDVTRLLSLMANQWIPCFERMPKERDSIFSKLYGTEKWRDAMFRKTSDTVICTVQYRDGTRQTAPCYTIDGEWNQSIKGMGKVLAWMPLPDPYKEGEQ